MSLRLSGDVGGDPPDLLPCARESPCERSSESNFEIEKKCETTDPTDSHRPCPFAPRILTSSPPGTRERLREIIKKFPNPRKSLSYFHSKSAAFLRHGIKEERLWPQSESEQRGSSVDDKGPPLSAPTVWEQDMRPPIIAPATIEMVSAPNPGIPAPPLLTPPRNGL
jgi:hypothetical protein